MFDKFSEYDMIAQRYGMSPFEVPKQFSPQQILFVVTMISEENLYRKEIHDNAEKEAKRKR